MNQNEFLEKKVMDLLMRINMTVKISDGATDT